MMYFLLLTTTKAANKVVTAVTELQLTEATRNSRVFLIKLITLNEASKNSNYV